MACTSYSYQGGPQNSISNEQKSSMDYSLLINAVETYKCLYDKSHKEYKNLLIKENAWGEISEITKIKKEDCKRRWNLLRERFNKEIKKISNEASGSASSVRDEWPYLESMMFLKEFIQPRRTKTNYADVADTEDADDNDQTPKKSKPDPFAETCVTFNEILRKFQEKQTKPNENDVEEQFLKTIMLLYKDLPESVKNTARVDILTYVTNLRTQYLN